MEEGTGEVMMDGEATQSSPPVTLVGHPFAPIGRGEDVRCAARAAQEVGIPFTILDLDQNQHPDDQALAAEFQPYVEDELTSSLQLWFINGDEVGDVLARFPSLSNTGNYQVIIPQWELERYPPIWAEQINSFDEVWAPSRFVARALDGAVSTPIGYVPLAVSPRLASFLPRRYFDLPESSFLFLFSFDFSSYKERKNPGAVIDVFEQVCQRLGPVDIRLVIKSSAPWPEERFQVREQQLLERIRHSPCADRIIHISQLMTDNEVKNLIRCCDCYLSLHRSEGFGRGLAEAMYFGRPVIATGYSGNMDFMTAEHSYVVDYERIPVKKGEYPHHEDQVWADPDLQDAVDHAIHVYHEQEQARSIGRAASRWIRTHFSYRAVGLQYRKRFDQIVRNLT